MITVKTAMTFDRVLQRAEEPRVTDDVPESEQALLDYLDATIESGIYKTFNGKVFDIKIPVDFAPEHVLEALRRRYEEGGWAVGSFHVIHPDTGNILAYQMVFCPTIAIITTAGAGAPVETPVKPESPPKRVRAPGDKPRVLLVSDVPGWAFDQNMRDLAAYLEDRFTFGFFYTENWFKGERPTWTDYDVIYEAYHRNPAMGIPLDRAVGALRSEWWNPERPAAPGPVEIARVNEYQAFQVAVQRNLEEFAPHCPNIVYLTNPVNVRRFQQTPERSEIIASWNGNARHKSPDGRFIKHFYDITLPACLKAGVPLVAAEYGTKEGPMRRRTSAEMSDFYQQANVAICASEYEAASNSVMEAMASGLALLATDVGNHREMRDAQIAAYGDTGILLVERDVHEFSRALRELTPARARRMGEINRAEIEARWSWSVWADRYEAFLRMAL